MYHTKTGKITVSHIWSYAKGTPLINETGAEGVVGDTKLKIKSNQVVLSSITRAVVTQSPEPEAHVLCVRAFRVELEFKSDGFWGEGETREPGEKPLGAEKESATNLAHIWSKLRIEPGQHRWECSHHCANPAPHSMRKISKFKIEEWRWLQYFMIWRLVTNTSFHCRKPTAQDLLQKWWKIQSLLTTAANRGPLGAEPRKANTKQRSTPLIIITMKLSFYKHKWRCYYV